MVVIFLSHHNKWYFTFFPFILNISDRLTEIFNIFSFLKDSTFDIRSKIIPRKTP